MMLRRCQYRKPLQPGRQPSSRYPPAYRSAPEPDAHRNRRLSGLRYLGWPQRLFKLNHLNKKSVNESSGADTETLFNRFANHIAARFQVYFTHIQDHVV
ncbi:hypothetical protein DESC_700008 [Desulfosarcina cetonica]|nr:hypothetical protein DESC_700008 [Desulfosarcina cetonica]